MKLPVFKRCCLIFLIVLGMRIPCIAGAAELNAAVLPAHAPLTGLSVENTKGLSRMRMTFETTSSGPQSQEQAQAAIRSSLEYFFLGLVIPDSKFWVNLNPSSPTEVMEPVLAQTGLGKVLLSSDMRLKKDVCDLTNPQGSSVGKKFWNQLYARAQELGLQGSFPIANRVWIVPEQTQVLESEDSIRILSQRLSVRLESDYFSSNKDSADFGQQQLNEYAAALMKKLVVPALEKKVNESAQYADLRDLCQALAAARWYREKFGFRPDSLAQLSASAVLDDVEANTTYGPEKAYQDYMRSVSAGEYNLSSQQSGSQGMVATTQISGGIDLRRLRRDPSAAKAHKPRQVFSVQISIPQGFKRPLRYAKQQLETIEQDLFQKSTDKVEGFIDQMPRISGQALSQQKAQELMVLRLVEQIAASKL